MIEVVCCTYGQDECLKCLINAFKCQTNTDWFMRILHDGPGDNYEKLREDLNKNGYLTDQITIDATPERKNDYGHSSRDFALKNPTKDSDFVLLTNGDNYYLPTFVEAMVEIIDQEEDVDFIYYNYIQKLDHKIHGGHRDRFFPMDNQIREGWIDMGSAIVATDIARAIGFNNVSAYNGDYLYFKDCIEVMDTKDTNAIIKSNEYLYVHT